MIILVTKDIGECDRIQETDKFTDIINTHNMHDSVHYIKTNFKSKTNFSFHLVTEDVILKKLLNLNVKKSTGWDNMPPKLLKQGANVLCKPIAMLVNKCIRLAKFPADLKKGEIIPLFFCLFSVNLSGYHKQYSRQHVLMINLWFMDK